MFARPWHGGAAHAQRAAAPTRRRLSEDAVRRARRRPGRDAKAAARSALCATTAAAIKTMLKTHSCPEYATARNVSSHSIR